MAPRAALRIAITNAKLPPSQPAMYVSQFDQRGSYAKLLRRSKKFHQLCILSCTIQ